MAEQVITLVKIPIKEIEEWIRKKHMLPMVLSDFRLEGDNLVLTFHEEPPTETQGDVPSPKTRTRRRRARKRRNRMKTRGWKVVARITNSKGQKCAIYKPFVDALKDHEMAVDEQRKIVERILRSNRNRPDANSINYYLENTLEYLKGRS
jgi:hypothetical protein